MLESFLHLNNTYQGVILPLAVYPFGVYFMAIYSLDAVPDTLLDASRIDGAGELAIFWRVARPILMPGMVTLFLLSFIGTWNNFFLPLVLLGDTNRFPLTVGLSGWASDLHQAGHWAAALPPGPARLADLGPAHAHPVPVPAEVRGPGTDVRRDRRRLRTDREDARR